MSYWIGFQLKRLSIRLGSYWIDLLLDWVTIGFVRLVSCLSLDMFFIGLVSYIGLSSFGIGYVLNCVLSDCWFSIELISYRIGFRLDWFTGGLVNYLIRLLIHWYTGGLVYWWIGQLLD